MSGADQTGTDRRRRLLFAGLALLVVVGLALGAASLDEVRLSSAGGTGEYDADEPINVGDTQLQPHSAESGQSGRLTVWFFLAVYVIGAIATVALAWRRDVQTVWVAMAALIVIFLFLAMLAGMGGNPFAETNASANVTEQPEDTQLGSGSGTEPNTVPPATALPTGALVFIGFVVGLAVLVGFSRSNSPDPDDEDGEAVADEGTVASIGAAAGRAADRLEESTGDNPVYEAWRDMRATLEDEEDPTLTPTEFRDRAIAAGIPPGPAGELTAVFREVRYGHEPPTDDRVEAAQAALRKVEAVAADLTAPEGQAAVDRPERTGDSTGTTDTLATTGEDEEPDEPDESRGSAARSDEAGDEP
jgi:hypothetical protein